MKRYLIILKVIISLSLIYLAAGKIDFTQLKNLWSDINPWFLIWAYLLMLISALVNSIKWKGLLKVQKLNPPLKNVLMHYLTGYFFNNFLTGAGEVKRVLDLSKETGNSQGVAASVFMERWTGIICQVGFALILLGWAYQEIPQLQTILIVCGVLFAALLIIFLCLGELSRFPFVNRIKPLWNWLSTFKQAYNQYVKKPSSLIQAFLLSLITPVLLILIHWMITKSLGYSIEFRLFVLFIPIISVFAQIPITVNGLGIQEMLFVQLFGIAGVSPETAFSVSLLSHLLKISVGLPGGIIYLIQKTPNKDMKTIKGIPTAAP